MYCAYCNEKIQGRPIRQGGDFFCSLECANSASGVIMEEPEEYYEENELEGLFEEEE